MNANRQQTSQVAPAKPEWLNLVRQQVGALRYGIVQIVVDDGKVTLVETVERGRFGQKFTN